MTGVDLGIVLLVVVGAAWGAWVGAARQIVDGAAWLASIVAPYGLAAPIAHALAGPLDVPYPLAFLLAALATSLTAYVVARLLWGAVTRMLFARRKKRDDEEDDARDDGPSGRNRAVGSFIGAGKMAAVLWVVISVVALVAVPFEARGIKLRFSDSTVYGLCQRHNLLGVLFHDRFEALHKALAKTGKKAPKGELAELGHDARFQALAKDDALRKAIEQGDALSLARSPQLLSIITDAKTMAQVFAAGAELHAGLDSTGE